MNCTKLSVERVEKRGVVDGKCKVCGEQILLLGTGRSIWIDGFNGGPGTVEMVSEAYCPKCDKEPKLPSYGTPIYQSEFIQVETA